MSTVQIIKPDPAIMAEVRALVELLLDRSRSSGVPESWRKECHDLAIYLAKLSATPLLVGDDQVEP